MTTDVETSAEVQESELTDAARAALHGGWNRRSKRRDHLLRMRDYRNGQAGIPDVPDGANEELEDIAKNCVLNMVGVVVDVFRFGLAVVGFRSPDSEDDDPAWQWWQEQGLDARQAEIHEATNTYGYAFASVLPDDDADGPQAHLWSPLDVDAVYENPRTDRFPTSATLWREIDGGWSVFILDKRMVRSATIKKRRKNPDLDNFEVVAEWEHGATYHGEPVVPLVRFLNEDVSEDRDPRGEVEPLIRLQRALNGVNFDRLTASRWSIFNQKVVIGWSARKDQVLKASNSRVWTFPDLPGDVDVKSLPATPIEPYNALIRDLKEQVALQGSIPIYQATGSVANVSENTVAMVDAAYQAKLDIKKDSLGESWETLLRLAVAMNGGEEPADSAETIWRDTRPRSLGVVVDGISKLAAGGVPIDEVLDLVPTLSQPRIDAIKERIRRNESGTRMQALIEAGRQAPQVPAEQPSA